MEQYEAILKQHKLRDTKPRRIVFETFLDYPGTLSISTLSKLCLSVDRVTLYRTLELFMQLGIIQVVMVGWKKRYELTEQFAPHHHHMQCTSCGALIDIQSDKLEALVHTLADEYQFMPTSHSFEVHGLCSNCSDPS